MYGHDELIHLCSRLTQRRLERWIDSGWISPISNADKDAFDDLDRSRADLICYLLDELEVQEDAIPIVLTLLDQVYSLRGEMRSLMKAVAQQPDSIRSEIMIEMAKDKGLP